MKKSLSGLTIVFAVAATAFSAHAANVGFNMGINIGTIPVPVVASPPVLAVPAPLYAPPPPLVFDEPPEFVAQPSMGFYAAVGTPHDLFYASNRYYLCRGNAWYVAPYYNGPWVQVGYRSVPWGLRRYPIARIRHMRDEGCRNYRDDDYGYRHFRPAWKDWHERHARWEGEREYGRRHDGRWEHGERGDHD